MAEFWEQQLMDRLMTLCFEYRKQNQETMPKEQVREVLDYVKFLLDDYKR